MPEQALFHIPESETSRGEYPASFEFARLMTLGRYLNLLAILDNATYSATTTSETAIQNSTEGTFVVCSDCRWIDACESNKHCART